ncbi:uncharacterized protein LAJ45_08591 [Morchella importuna]|uniref:uncharacterized protein n=1 Tax=Morchella importuna TaxID=1174673 RepID=UPI001E8DDF0E|nr:uncharacterized protein LAJ45_08591 [Morchella importuna]KAH8147435.1 hypothetical protein LAJ45_08591 [Morchella importuna]
MGQGNPESRLSMRTKKRPVVDDDNDDPRSWIPLHVLKYDDEHGIGSSDRLQGSLGTFLWAKSPSILQIRVVID